MRLVRSALGGTVLVAIIAGAAWWSGGGSWLMERRVLRLAEAAVLEKLTVPSTARFVGTAIVDQRLGKPFDRYQLEVKVDAQNPMGVYLRGQYCVILFADGKKAYLVGEYGVVECAPKDGQAPGVRQIYMTYFRRLAGWDSEVPAVDKVVTLD